MAHQYSVEIHNLLTSILKESESEIEELKKMSDSDFGRIRHLEGKIDEVLFFRNYLSKNFDLVTQKYF